MTWRRRGKDETPGMQVVLHFESRDVADNRAYEGQDEGLIGT